MPTHPASPEDRSALLDAFEHAVRAITDIGFACSDEYFDRETERPGWTVKDQVAPL
jgi:hypothetical protein